MIDTRYFSPLQQLSSWERTCTGLCAVVDDTTVAIDVFGKDMFRIQIPATGHSLGEPGYAVSADLSTFGAAFTIEETGDSLRVKTDHVSVTVSKAPFRIEAHRTDGSVIFETPSENGVGSYARLNDAFVVTRKRRSDDVVLGLGQKTGRMDRNNRNFTLWNTDVLDPSAVSEFASGRAPEDPRSDPRSTDWDPYYMSIPFYQRLDKDGAAAGFFLDNCRRGHYSFDIEGETQIHFSGGPYIEYVFAGPSLASIVSDYTSLTGRMPAPPIWALGYHHCRWHPYTQKDVLRIAETYRKRGIPCDSMWLDIDHMNGYRVFTWNKKTYPDPPKMLEKLRKLGLRTITIIDPGVKVDPGYEVYDSGVARDVFCRTEGGAVYQGQVWPGRTAFPDFATERARTWWGELNARHVASGIAGIWNDMNEPATGQIHGDAMRFDGGRLSHGAYRNSYALLMAMGTVEGLRKAMPDLRTFVLSRAGSAGIQRYAANWLGDNMSRWDHLDMSVPMSLGLGLSGQSFVGADIGGFGENTNPELLVRWFQAATLSPFCRHHNDAGSIDQYPWSFGKDVEEKCVASLKLRYQLMPYLYTTFVETAETGMPIMRPMVLTHQSTPALWKVDDQYMLGPSLLVAPVTAAGVKSRKVVLPEGSWYDWADDSVHRGVVECKTPLERIPMFAREGSVVPIWPEIPASTMDYRPEAIELELFVPTRDGSFVSTLVEDDGETFGYRRGERLTTTLTVTREGRTLSLVGVTTGKPFEGFRRKAFHIRLHGVADARTHVVASACGGFEWSVLLP
jgi:alpha-glucosidase